MGFLGWMKRDGSEEKVAVPEGAVGPKPSRTDSIFGNYPDRVLKTEADVKKDDALLDMTLVVNEILKDPDTNWRKYQGDFEKAVNAMREAFEPEMRPGKEEKNRELKEQSESVSFAPKERGLPFERGDRIIAAEPFQYGGKPRSNPDTPGVVDGVYDNGQRICYHRLGMPPGNVPADSVRHANEQDLRQYENKFATLEARRQQQKRNHGLER